MDDRTSQLCKLRKDWVERWHCESNARVRVEMQCFIAAIDNMLDLIVGVIVDRVIIDKLIALLSDEQIDKPARIQ